MINQGKLLFQRVSETFFLYSFQTDELIALLITKCKKNSKSSSHFSKRWWPLLWKLETKNILWATVLWLNTSCWYKTSKWKENIKKKNLKQISYNSRQAHQNLFKKFKSNSNWSKKRKEFQPNWLFFCKVLSSVSFSLPWTHHKWRNRVEKGP